MMFASTETPDANSFLQFWLIIGFLASIFSNIVVAVVVLIGRKQKREVSFTFDPVSKEEFEKLIANNQREHENLFKKIGGVERGANERLDQHLQAMQRSAEDGREKIHKRLNRISIGLANICGRIGAPLPSEEEEA